MTTSPLKRKGELLCRNVSGFWLLTFNIDCEDQIAKLEEILDSKVYTLEDRTEVDVFIPTPTPIKIISLSHVAVTFVCLSKYEAWLH